MEDRRGLFIYQILVIETMQVSPHRTNLPTPNIDHCLTTMKYYIDVCDIA